ncbi:unnamed protein product, partial [Phaeothamnion confervicola]
PGKPPKLLERDPGWDIYNAEAEYERQGTLRLRPNGSRSPWRTTAINDRHRVSASYPRVLVVPAETSDGDLEAAAQFRSEGRLPVLTWGNGTDAASVWRSSQPRVGPLGAASLEDQALLEAVADPTMQVCPSSHLYIADCRSHTNGLANRAAGYGFEYGANYCRTKLHFLGIGNIHTMREAQGKLDQLVRCHGHTQVRDVS